MFMVVIGPLTLWLGCCDTGLRTKNAVLIWDPDQSILGDNSYEPNRITIALAWAVTHGL